MGKITTVIRQKEAKSSVIFIYLEKKKRALEKSITTLQKKGGEGLVGEDCA